ncbi:hypothetical protein MAPG_00783 [Magnaporthiopsis poae ATCC 64411]|uniref:Bromo domain-containing protein n=1 Tax=Magnaporthiopsis poae (strain ATCC 64411 / 73-15) TaxID=644358 RepID=A0A0C4DLY3_MAGP6|nr:hypothetical protein MAPG_00783 [Magnaporthiopsis poae ATCC 64411]
MFNIAAYTPLESLLLIQSLVAHGSVDPPAFTHVSSLLTTNSFIKDDDRYDEKRLSPGSLQELFLQILRDELRLEVENTDKAALDGSASPNKRRKLQAPSPYTLQEAYPYLPKVPALIDRLYSRYQEHQIRRIREDEEKFDRVQSEIKALLEEEDRERKEKEAREAQRQRDAAIRNHVPPVKPEERRGTVLLPNGTGATAGAGPALAPSLGSTAQPAERPHPVAVAPVPPPTPKPPRPAISTSKPASGLPKQPSPSLKPAPLHAPAAAPALPVPSPRPSAPATPNLAAPNQLGPTTAHPPSPSTAPALARPIAAPGSGAPNTPLQPHTSQVAAHAAVAGAKAQPSAIHHGNVPARRPAPVVAPQHSPAASNPAPLTPLLAKTGVAPPSQFGQAAAPDARHEPARPANGAVSSPVLQHPQGVVVSSRPTQSPQPPPPQLGVLQRPETVGKPKAPPPPQQATPTPPAGTPLKWEPPYKPPQPSTPSQRPQVGPPGAGHHHNMVPQTWTPHTHAQVQAHAQAQAAAMHAQAQAQAAQAQAAKSQTAQAQTAPAQTQVPHVQAVQGYVQAHPQGQTQAQTQAQVKTQNQVPPQGQVPSPYQSPAQLQARNAKPQQAPKPPPQPSHPVIFSHKPVLVPPQHASQGQLHAPAVDSKRPPVPVTASTQQPQRAPQSQPAQPIPGQATAPSVPPTPIPAQAAPAAHRPPAAKSPTLTPTPTHPPPPKRLSPTQSHQSPRISNHTQSQPPKSTPNHQQVYPNPQPHAQQQSPIQQQTRPHPPPLQQSIQPQVPVRPPVPVSVAQNTQLVPAVPAPVKIASPGPPAHSPSTPSLVSQPEAPKPHASPYDTTTTPVAAASGILKPQVSTPKPSAPGHRWTPLLPQTPANAGDVGYFPRHGSATKWKSNPTPSTPNAVEASGMAAPRAEPLSPVRSPATLAVAGVTPEVSLEGLANSAASRQSQPKAQSKKQQVQKLETGSLPKARQARQPRGKFHDAQDLPPSKEVEAQQQQRPLDEPHEAAKEPDSAKVKDEEETPRPSEETGDTTADESGPSQRHPAPSSTLPSRRGKRKRGESSGPDRTDVTPASISEAPPETTTAAAPAPTPAISLSEPPSHILWTRGFPRISSSALDQIGSHRHANMFAHQIRDRDAPGYKSIVLGPMDLKSIRAAINHGNKAATQAAAALPDGDPGTSTVWLPISEDLVPPRGIINSAQLDRELVHMFANAIMYNPDPQRGFGPSFLRDDDEDEAADEADASTAAAGMPGSNVLGYKVDENAVVNDTRSMFVEVEKLLSNMRAAEISRGAPPPPPGSTGLVSATAEDDDANRGASLDGAEDREGTAATDGDGTASGTAGTSGTTKRRRITRG